MTANDTTTATANCVVRSLWVLPMMSVQRNLRLECKVDQQRSQTSPFGLTAPRDPEFLNINGTRQDAAIRSPHNDAPIVLAKLEC